MPSVDNPSARFEAKQKRLQDEVNTWLRSPTDIPVNFSIHRHSAIVPVLRNLVYDQRLARKSLPIKFRDGSQPTPFPLGAFSSDSHAKRDDLPVIRLGLISFRHPDMDFLVDQYFLTNKELEENRKMAESEQKAFLLAKKTLADASIKDGATIHLYQTGLEPAVVGFYRGVVDVLRQRALARLPRTLTIIPCVFAAEFENAPWTEKSPGAQAKSYVEYAPWY